MEYSFVANLFDLFRSMGHLPGAIVEETETISRHVAAPFNPMFKGVWHARLSDEQAEAAIADSVTWFKSHDAPFAFWWVDPQAPRRTWRPGWKDTPSSPGKSTRRGWPPGGLRIGAAITLAAFEEDRDLGYNHAVLFGTDSGAPVYRRIGFQDVGATISRYLWRA